MFDAIDFANGLAVVRVLLTDAVLCSSVLYVARIRIAIVSAGVRNATRDIARWRIGPNTR